MLAPKVDTAAKNRPGWRPRIPSMRLYKPGIGLPHNFLKFPEFTKEARVTVVDAFRVFFHKRMHVTFDIPDTVR